jgi:tRNA threonylcarbamoyladenosine modification (KEOPS) complex Cgi121 subunit
LRIEQLGNDETKEFVAIAELHNSSHLNQDELIKLATSMSKKSLTAQLLNGHLIAGESHLLSAVQNAVNSRQGEYMLSRSLDVEIVVYASTQKQIGKALDALGVFDGLESIATVVVGSDRVQVEESIQKLIETIGDEVLPPFKPSVERIERIKKHYQIEDREIDAIAESEDVDSRMTALSRCISSRVSLVAFDS